MADYIPRSQLVGADPVWLIRWTWAGRDFHYSTRRVDPVDADGVAIPHRAMLTSLSLDSDFNLLADAASERSAVVEIFPEIDVGALVSQGHDLNTGTAELSLWVEGTPYEDRVVMLTGDTGSPGYGAINEPINFSLSERAWDDVGQILDPAGKITSETWPEYGGDAVGKFYPLVFGTPGEYRTSSGVSAVAAATPAYKIEDSPSVWNFLIAGHRVAASFVRLENLSDGTSADAQVYHKADGLGKEIAYCSVSALGTPPLTLDSEHEYACYWTNTTGSGLVVGTKEIRRGGDVLEYMLDLSSIDLDRGKTSAALGALNGLLIDGYIDEQSSPVEWLMDNLYPLLPVSIVRGLNGLYPLVWNPTASGAEALEALVAGPGFARTGPVQYEGEISNKLAIQYALNINKLQYQRSITLGKIATGRGADYLQSLGATVSASRYGERAADPMESDIIYKDEAAAWVLMWMIQRDGFPKRVIQYEADPVYAWIPTGAVVTLTDSELNLTEYPALWIPTWRDNLLVARLVLLNNPNLDQGN